MLPNPAQKTKQKTRTQISSAQKEEEKKKKVIIIWKKKQTKNNKKYLLLWCCIANQFFISGFQSLQHFITSANLQ